MFGLGNRNKPAQADMQIPYEVYETIHEPTARRRRWFVRLAAALIVVTLLIVGGMTLRRMLNDNNGQDPSSQSQSDQSKDQANDREGTGGTPLPPQTVVQSPQQNTPLPSAGPGAVPATPNTTQNNGTVRKPE